MLVAGEIHYRDGRYWRDRLHSLQIGCDQRRLPVADFGRAARPVGVRSVTLINGKSIDNRLREGVCFITVIGISESFAVEAPSLVHRHPMCPFECPTNLCDLWRPADDVVDEASKMMAAVLRSP
jgi:hypothetical protein